MSWNCNEEKILCKPTRVMSVNWEHPLNYRLAASFHPDYNEGNCTRDFVRGLVLPLVSGATYSSTYGGSGIKSVASKQGAITRLPDYLKVGWPMTISTRVTILDTPVIYSVFFGLSYQEPEASPYQIVTIQSVGNKYTLYWNTGGSPANIQSSNTIAVGSLDHIVGVVTAAKRDLYVNAVLVASETNNHVDPNTTATSNIALGQQDQTLADRYPNAVLHSGELYHRDLTYGEIVELYRKPYGTPTNPRFV